MTDKTKLHFGYAPNFHYYTANDGKLEAATRPAAATWSKIVGKFLSKHKITNNKQGWYITFGGFAESAESKLARDGGKDAEGNRKPPVEYGEPLKLAHRTKDNTTRLHALVYDLDNHTKIPYKFDELVMLLDKADVNYAIYTSHSFDPTKTDDDPEKNKTKKFRIFIPLAEPIEKSVYKAALYGFAEQLELEMGAWDRASEVISQPMYLPACPESRKDVARIATETGKAHLNAAESIIVGMEFAPLDEEGIVQPDGAYTQRGLERQFNKAKTLHEVLLHFGYEHINDRYRRPESTSPPAVQITSKGGALTHSPEDPLYQEANGKRKAQNAYQAFVRISVKREELTLEEANAAARKYAGLDDSIVDLVGLHERYKFDVEKNKLFDTQTMTFLPFASLNTVHYGLFEDVPPSDMYRVDLDATDCFHTKTWQPAPYGEKPETIIPQGNRNALNLACEMLMQPMEGDVQQWLFLVDLIIPNEDEREAWLDWVAYTVLYPNKKLLWHPHIWGVERIGKDAIYKPVVDIMNSGLISMAVGIDQKSVLGDFQDTIAGKRLLIISEVKQKKNEAFMEKLKLYMAGSATGEMTVNPKGLTEYQQPNLLSIATISNHKGAFLLSKGNTRHLIIKAGLEFQIPQEFYDSYFDWFKHDFGSEKVLNFLMHRDLSDFTPDKLPIRTEAVEEHAEESDQRDWWDVIEGSILPKMVERGIFATEQIHEDLSAMRRGSRTLPGLKGITQKLCKIDGLVKISGRKKISGVPMRTPTAFCTREAWEAGLKDKTQTELFDIIHSKVSPVC